mmetsp:Transcript_12704/g.26750  ORF Transcript_12704/g.26750 Transcript_12704/m.26750 type:complete len:295 (-) Transcript_12704:406-1290(-)
MVQLSSPHRHRHGHGGYGRGGSKATPHCGTTFHNIVDQQGNRIFVFVGIVGLAVLAQTSSFEMILQTAGPFDVHGFLLRGNRRVRLVDCLFAHVVTVVLGVVVFVLVVVVVLVVVFVVVVFVVVVFVIVVVVVVVGGLVCVRKVVVRIVFQWQIDQFVRGVYSGDGLHGFGKNASPALPPRRAFQLLLLQRMLALLVLENGHAPLQIVRRHVLGDLGNGRFQLGDLRFEQRVLALQFPGFFLADGLHQVCGGGVGNVPCLRGVPQRVDGFFDVEIGGAHAGNHDGAGIPAQRIL